MNTTPKGAAPGIPEAGEEVTRSERPVANPDPHQLARATRFASAAHDLKARAIVVLDAREVSAFADTFILATGTSQRHAQAIADAVRDAAREEGETPIGTEGYDEGRWILVDFGDTIVHVFTREVRDHYDLERLWSDAPLLDLGLPGDDESEGDRAGKGAA